MLPDSLIRAVDTVVVSETVRVASDTVRIAGRVFADTARWWPAVYAGLGALAGGLVTAVLNFLLNRRLEVQRTEESRKQFRWEREQNSAMQTVEALLAVTGSLLDFQSLLGALSMFTATAAEARKRTEQIAVLERKISDLTLQLQANVRQLTTRLTLFPGYWESLAPASKGLASTWARLNATIVDLTGLRPSEILAHSQSADGDLSRLRQALSALDRDIEEFIGFCTELIARVQLESATRNEATEVIDDTKPDKGQPSSTVSREDA